MSTDPPPDRPATPRRPTGWGEQPGPAQPWGPREDPGARAGATRPTGWGPPDPGAGSPGAPPGGIPPAPVAPDADDAPQPGIVPLRPLTLGEIYDGAFRAIRANPRVLFTFAAAVVAAVGLLQAFAAWRTRSALAELERWVDSSGVPDEGREVELLAAQLVTGALGQLLAWVATTVLTGLLVRTVHAAVRGTTPTVREAWDGVRPLVWRLLGLSVLVVVGLGTLVVVPPAALGTLGAAFAGVGGAVGGVTVGLVVALAAAIVVIPRTVLATPALAIEERGVGSALGRAWRLARGSSARVLGILVLTWILVGVANGIITYPLGLLGGAIDPSGLGGAYVLGTVGAIAASAVTTPVAAAVTSLLYLDLRLRREGADAVLR